MNLADFYVKQCGHKFRYCTYVYRHYFLVVYNKQTFSNLQNSIAISYVAHIFILLLPLVSANIGWYNITVLNRYYIQLYTITNTCIWDESESVFRRCNNAFAFKLA